MSTVTLSIGPKTYTVACADGQEAHITKLGDMIAAKYAQLGQARAPLEAQNLLFAALFMADELAEARKTLAAAQPSAPAADGPLPDPAEVESLRKTVSRLEAELAAARAEAFVAQAAAPAAPPQFDLFGGPATAPSEAETIADQLEALAARIEASAAALEAAATSA